MPSSASENDGATARLAAGAARVLLLEGRMTTQNVPVVAGGIRPGPGGDYLRQGQRRRLTALLNSGRAVSGGRWRTVPAGTRRSRPVYNGAGSGLLDRQRDGQNGTSTA